MLFKRGLQEDIYLGKEQYSIDLRLKLKVGSVRLRHKIEYYFRNELDSYTPITHLLEDYLFALEGAVRYGI